MSDELQFVVAPTRDAQNIRASSARFDKLKFVGH